MQWVYLTASARHQTSWGMLWRLAVSWQKYNLAPNRQDVETVADAPGPNSLDVSGLS